MNWMLGTTLKKGTGSEPGSDNTNQNRALRVACPLFHLGVTVGLTMLLAAAGCLKRYEKISIARDGAVTIEITYSGEPGDFEGGDAVPSKEAGWEVTRTNEHQPRVTRIENPDGTTVEVKTESLPQMEDGTEIVLSAKRVFPPGAELPRTFAAPNDPETELYLDFPTQVKIEERGDGTYYHFRRVYTPRRWAQMNYWQEAIFDDDMKELAEKSPEDMTRDERKELLKAFAQVEAGKQIEFAREALRKCDPDLPPERRLLVQQALGNVYRHGINWDRLLTIFGESEDDKKRDELLHQESERVQQEAHTALLSGLRTYAGYDKAKIAKFEDAYQRAKRFYEITDNQGLHVFTIEVEMPGEIIASNCGTLSEEGNPAWAFKGDAFRDRAMELLVTSRVPREKKD